MQPIKTLAGELSLGNGPAKGGGGGKGGSFIDRLTASLEELTGREIDSEQIAAWLAGENPDGFPGSEELAKLLEQFLPPSGGSDVAAVLPQAGSDGETDAAGEVDVAALIGALVAAEGGGGREGSGLQQAKALSASLSDRNPAAMRQLIDGLRPAAERGDGQGFRDLMATVAALDGQAQATTAGRSAADATPTAALRVATPVGQPGFTQAVGEQVTWMVRNEVQSARVQLDPPDLGPLEITVSLRDDRASVAIHAHNASTREALLADSTRLRAMLEDNGFTGVDVSVREERPDGGGREGHAGGDGQGGAGGDAFAGGDGAAPEQGTTSVRSGRGLVDHYV